MSGFYFPLTLGVAQRRPQVSPNGGRTPGERRPGEYEVWREGVERLPADVEYVREPETRVLEQLQRQPRSSPRFWLVLGEPGGGKSTLLRAWFTRWASQLAASKLALSDAVPVLVRLGELKETDWAREGDAFADRLWQQGAECRALLDASSEGLGAWLYDLSSARRGRLFTPVWLLDGLDEVRRVPVDDVLLRRLVNLPGRKVVTCRVAAFASLRAIANPYQAPEREYELLGLTVAEQRAFLTQALDGEGACAEALLRALPTSLRPLAANPLMLALIAQVGDPAQLPATRAGFYGDAVKQLWHRKVGAALSDAEDAQLARRRDQLLEQAAAVLGMHHVTGELSQLYDLGAAQGREGDRAVELVLRTGLLRVDRRAETFAFEHLTFQEYYLARALHDADFRETLEHHWASPRYEETLALLIALRVEAGSGNEVGTALRWLVEWGETTHHTDPKQLWNLGRSPLRTVLRLLGRAAVPLETMPGFEPWLWEHLARSRVPTRTRLAVAQVPILPPEVLVCLRADPDPGVRRAVAQNPSAPADVLARLAADPDPLVRYRVGRNPSTFADVLARLAADPECDTRWGVAENPSLAAEVQACLSADTHPYVRFAMAHNPASSAEALARLAADPESLVRSSVGHNPSASAEVLARLAVDVEADVRRTVAENPSAPADVLARLAADPDPLVRRAIAAHPSRSAEILARRVADPDPCVRWGVAGDPSTPAEVLAGLAADPDPGIRSGVAENPSASAELLSRLSEDPDPYVRRTVAGNPSACAEVLARLAVDPDREVRVRLLGNPSLSADVLARLAVDPDSSIRWGVAFNETASSNVLACLAGDLDEGVCLSAVSNSGFLLEDLTA